MGYRATSLPQQSQAIHLLSPPPPPSALGHPPVQLKEPVVRDDSTGEPRSWEEWVQRYADGKWDPERPIPKPSALAAIAEEMNAKVENTPMLPDGEGTFGVYTATSLQDSDSSSTPSVGGGASDLLAFYKVHGYWPAPKGQFEGERLRMMKRYGLEDTRRREAIDRVCQLAKFMFAQDSVIISLIFDKHAVIAAEAGFDPNGDPSLDIPVRESALSSNLCAHAITKTGNTPQTMIVGDVSKDWRFANNPQSLANGGSLAFYASATINLPTLAPEASHPVGLPAKLPVGSLCLCSSEPRDPAAFTDQQRKVLASLADMVAREFALGYEASRREAEQRQTEFLASFIQSSLADPLEPSRPPLRPSTSSNESITAATLHEAPSTTAIAEASISTPNASSGLGTSLESTFEAATKQAMLLTEASSVAILDLRSFRAPLKRVSSNVAGANRTRSRTDASTRGGAGQLFELGQGKMHLLGSAGEVSWETVVKGQEQLGEAVVRFMKGHYKDGMTEFDQSTRLSPFAGLLATPAKAWCAVPIIDRDGSPELLLLLTSSEDHFSFEPADSKFIHATGTVLASALLRERVIAADRAKLAFVSQVSHELRTPLHGMSSQLELIRECSSPRNLVKLAPMLDVCDICVDSLRDVLDDTLDYAKFSSDTGEPTHVGRSHGGSRQPANLAKLTEDVTKVTFVRQRRVNLVTAGKPTTLSSAHPDNPSKVEVLLEVQDGVKWDVLVDVGGLKRVLLNIIGNATKFTTEGYIKVTLGQSSTLQPDGEKLFYVDVEDTGCGMSEDFLRSGRLFSPFVQENPFANGAGLGMSIVEEITKRLGGKIEVASVLGQGTTMRVVVPLEIVGDADSPTPLVTPISQTLPKLQRTDTQPLPKLQRTDTSSTSYSSPSSGTPTSPGFSTRFVSREMDALFAPGGSATPGEELSFLDFGQAVTNAQTALGTPTLKRLPSNRRVPVPRQRRPSVSTQDIQIELVDSVAKLALSSETTVPPSPTPSNASSFSKDTTRHSSSSSFVPPTFILPSTLPFPGKKQLPASSTIPPPPAPPPEKLNVLFCDDSTIARQILAKLLTIKGIKFTSTEDGQQAVDAFKAGPRFHLVLADVQMPIKDGLQAAFEIRRHERANKLPPCRIVAISGLSNEADMERSGVLSGNGPMDAWIVKGARSLAQVREEILTVQAEVENPNKLTESEA